MRVDLWDVGDDYRLFSCLAEEVGAMEGGGKRTRGGATMNSNVTGLFPPYRARPKHTPTHPPANCPFARSRGLLVYMSPTPLLVSHCTMPSQSSSPVSNLLLWF